MVPKSKAALRSSRTSTDVSAQSEARSFVTFTLFLCWKLTETLQINHVCNRCSNKSSVSCLQLVIKNFWWTKSYRKLSSVSLPILDLITAAGIQRTPNAVWENTPGEQHLFVFWAILTRMLFRASYAQFLHSVSIIYFISECEVLSRCAHLCQWFCDCMDSFTQTLRCNAAIRQAWTFNMNSYYSHGISGCL